MNVTKLNTNNKLTIKIEGRVDTKTSPELEAAISDSLEGITDLTIDFADVAYISSAGLRVLLVTQKKMNKQGSMKVINVSEDIMDIFEVTGFSDILTIE